MPPEALAERLTAYCRAQRPLAQALRIDALQRIFGGASRETWRFRLVETVAGVEQSHDLILRRDPPASLIDTERRREFAAYRAFEGTAVPVPQTWWLEQDDRPLGSPFFVMQAVGGCEAVPMRLMAAPYLAHHAGIARQTWTILGEIARADPAALEGGSEGRNAADSWQHELEQWAGLIDRDALEPQPIAQAAIRWLRAHPPAPAARLSIVHGDYRIGNLLVSPEGEVRAVLDWELAHLGDPLEDLAWGLNRSWCFQHDDRVCGLVPRDQAIAIWQASSGLRAEPDALHWWELFSCIKGQAIWLGAARNVAQATNRDVLMALAGWMFGNSQDRAMLELMGHLE